MKKPATYQGFVKRSRYSCKVGDRNIYALVKKIRKGELRNGNEESNNEKNDGQESNS
jgi:hypothetical protein